MGRIGKNRAYISASAPKELVALIDERASALGWSRAQYTVAILEMWRANGSPPVSEPDKHMMVAKQVSAKPLPEHTKNPRATHAAPSRIPQAKNSAPRFTK